jgi:hypothetical protein
MKVNFGTKIENTKFHKNVTVGKETLTVKIL